MSLESERPSAFPQASDNSVSFPTTSPSRSATPQTAPASLPSAPTPVQNGAIPCPRCRAKAAQFAEPGAGDYLVTHVILHRFLMTLATLFFIPLLQAAAFFPAIVFLPVYIPQVNTLALVILGVQVLMLALTIIALVSTSRKLMRRFPELLFQCERCKLKF